MTAPTKTINDVEAVGYMNTSDCRISIRGNIEIKCLSYYEDHCRCPGAPLNSHRGRGIWIEKQKYLELRLLGELP